MTRWAIIAAVAVSGCVHVSSSVLDHGYQAYPYTLHEVDVFLLSDTPPTACERVALLHASGSNNASETKIIDKLREEAGTLGANAVHIQSAEDAGNVERALGEVFGSTSDKDWDALGTVLPGTRITVPVRLA